jgi:hypothetical protein
MMAMVIHKDRGIQYLGHVPYGTRLAQYQVQYLNTTLTASVILTLDSVSNAIRDIILTRWENASHTL